MIPYYLNLSTNFLWYKRNSISIGLIKISAQEFNEKVVNLKQELDSKICELAQISSSEPISNALPDEQNISTVIGADMSTQ